MFRIIPLCLILLITTSCFTHYKEAVNSLRGSMVCCGSMTEFKYEPILKEKGLTFKIDDSSSAYMFESGKSFFRAFALPKRDSPYYVNVKSFGLGGHIREAHIFYPQLSLLDEKYILLKQSGPADFSLKKAGLMEMVSISWTALRVKFEGSIFVDSPQARYIVIFTTDHLLNSSSPFSTLRAIPIIFPGFVTVLPAGMETERIAHSPFGLLHIAISDKPSPVSEKTLNGVFLFSPAKALTSHLNSNREKNQKVSILGGCL